MRMVYLKPEYPEAYFNKIAEMHASQIHHGLLPQLGIAFLSSLYRQVSREPQGIVIAALSGQGLIGFVAGSLDLDMMYKHILVKKGWLLLWCAMPYILRLDLLSKAWHVTRYPNKSIEKKNNFQPFQASTPELLSIAVSETFQRQGVGGKLIAQFECYLRDAGCYHKYRVATNARENASNAFYRQNGFEMIGTREHNDLTLRVYEKMLDFGAIKKKDSA